jgi:hypothetical protein
VSSGKRFWILTSDIRAGIEQFDHGIQPGNVENEGSVAGNVRALIIAQLER